MGGGEHGPGVRREVGGDLGVLRPLGLVLTGGSHFSFCRDGVPAHSLQREEHEQQTCWRRRGPHNHRHDGASLAWRPGKIEQTLWAHRLREENSEGRAARPATELKGNTAEGKAWPQETPSGRGSPVSTGKDHRDGGNIASQRHHPHV